MLRISHKCHKKKLRLVFTSNGVIIKSVDSVKAEAKAEKRRRKRINWAFILTVQPPTPTNWDHSIMSNRIVNGAETGHI